MAAPDPKLLLAADRETTRWRNGAGEATEVAIGPEGATADDFDWRVSIATIGTDADFSTYPGIQRYLMPLSTGGLTLMVDAQTHVLPGLQAFEFAGEALTRAIGVTASSLDLNLMVRRGAAQGRLATQAVRDELTLTAAPNETLLLVLLDAAFGLAALDAIQLSPNATVNLTGAGPIAVARIIHRAA